MSNDEVAKIIKIGIKSNQHPSEFKYRETRVGRLYENLFQSYTDFAFEMRKQSHDFVNDAYKNGCCSADTIKLYLKRHSVGLHDDSVNLVIDILKNKQRDVDNKLFEIFCEYWIDIDKTVDKFFGMNNAEQ